MKGRRAIIELLMVVVMLVVLALLGARGAFGQALPERHEFAGKSEAPVWREDHLRGFLGGWKDPKQMLQLAEGARDEAAIKRLQAYQKQGVAFMRLLVYVDQSLTVFPGELVITTADKKYTDLGLIEGKKKDLKPAQYVDLSPRSKQPIELIVILPRECSLAWITGIERPGIAPRQGGR